MSAPGHDRFRLPPFHLDDDALSWVAASLSRLTPEDQIRQLLIHEGTPSAGSGGAFIRCRAAAAELRARTAAVHALPGIPILTAADLEFTAHGRITDGTDHPCQMAVGAAGERELARRMGTIAGTEGLAAGIDWTFAPVADLALNHRSPSVNLRSFGADAARAAELVAAYVEGVQETGMAATLKHWPGDGLDERDQHFTTARNPLTVSEWRSSFGAVFAAGIRAGAKAVMSAHISFPAYALENGKTGTDAHLPASLSALLNIDLLRGELGFGGLIVTDALVMGGASSRLAWADLAPAAVGAGCDMVLFPPPDEESVAYFKRAIERGTLSRKRVEEAAARVLAFKASLGLHHGDAEKAMKSQAVARSSKAAERNAWARECAERSITLVKDTQRLLPLSAERTPRVLLFVSRPTEFIAAQRPFILDSILEEKGFETTVYREGTVVDRDLFDLLIYVVEEQPVFVAESLLIKWRRFGANHQATMRRYWRDFPTLFISLGSPFHAFELPACRTIINAYSSAEPSQRAVADALVGALPFRGVSPVDPFCGSADESE
ncbi:MAG: glycoside hydrolase family 3 N-terminal domain-containing protein [Treponemataceae bacterium]